MDFLLDTSFLVSSMGNRIEVTAELRKFGVPVLYVLDLVIEELEKLSARRGKDAVSARLALEFLKRENAAVIRVRKGNTDRKIIECSVKSNMTVCTMDKGLKEKLRRKGAGVIAIRQGRYLVRAE
jgi:rRNA-processing protein FCF1